MNDLEIFLTEQKEELLKSKKKIEERIVRLKEYPDYGTNEEDNLQELEDFENNLSIEEQLNFLLKKIERAINAINDGTYGQCSECRKNIERGRLKSMPYAELCITCKTNRKK